MKRILRAVLAVTLAASMTASAVPVMAKNDITLYATVDENINMNNCHILKTVYFLGDDAVYSLTKKKNGTLKAVTEITNYTANTCEFKAVAFAVDENGKMTEIASEQGSVVSGIKGKIEVSFDVSAVPSGTKEITTKILSTADGREYETTSIKYMDYDVFVPKKAPADAWHTTGGVHDPSIVKFPNDSKYYVYSSHHLIYTSEDLINWEKHDFTGINLAQISPKTQAFISANIDANVNGTYWAPDVIYVPEDTETPYWMYISVSCGLGGRNSAISLMKSPSPMFWADSENVAAIKDCGVVFATKETADYKTNAIDANIYTDKSGARYFIWGSFWGGIQGAKLTSDGFVDGIDYTSDETLISSSANFGKTLFSQKNGIAGPEGAWTIEHGDYRYMFTSYGWLGSNYNTRAARSPLSVDFAQALAEPTGEDSSFVDANGVVMGSEYASGSDNTATGYKLIGSYRLGGNGADEIKKNGDNYYVSYVDGGDPIYYGPGHNSVIKADDGEYYYVSHTRKNYVEGAAWLQVRKMLWTDSGWPVVSPVTYSGEKEQKLPIDMIYGSYDFVSIGITKMMGDTVAHRNFDVPMLSSKVTLLADGKLADGLGSWEFDGENTVTITFAVNGDTSKSQYFKSGDVAVMKAVLSYNKDTDDYVMALMGTDNSNVAQFAAKPMSEKVYTDSVDVTSKEIVIEKSKGGNPVLGFDDDGKLMYGGDPAALVDGDTVYLYVGHDTAADEAYKMPEYACYSSTDMINWKYERVVMKATDISWRNDDNSAWASQAVKYGDKYYLYFCTWDKTSSGKQSIGVAVSDSPTGPFKDIGAPLVKGTLTEPESSGWNDIDPTVWIEKDKDGAEHRYLAWGNGIYYMCELNEDMISVKDIDGDGNITMGKDVFQQTFTGMGGNGFTEAPWLYRRQNENGEYYGQYYTFFASNWREEMAYAVTDDITSNTWTYKGQLMPPTATSNTNHPSVIDFKGKTYFIYHNGALTKGSGFRRSVCIQEMGFDEFGNVYPIEELSTGIGGKAVTIQPKSGAYIAHDGFTNSSADGDYPIKKDIFTSSEQDGLNTAWEIVDGLYKPENESYVSIQAVNKPGLYIKIENGTAVLTQDADGNQAESMTFKTVAPLDGSENGVSFESISEQGKYLTVYDGKLMLTSGAVAQYSVFMINSGVMAKIEQATSQNGKVSFNLVDAGVYDELTAYIAEYENDKLVGAKVEKINVVSNNQTVSIDYLKKDENNDNVIRVYVWDNLTPVTKAVTAADSIIDSCTAYYSFDGKLENTVSGQSAVITGSKANAEAAVSEVQYENACGDKCDDKAVVFTGAESYGLNLGKIITKNKYTIMFDIKANEFTFGTPPLFIDVDGGSKWVSAPIGYQTDGTAMIWSNDGTNYYDCVSAHKSETGKWYNVIISVSDGHARMYVDGKFVGDGKISDSITADTNTYLAVNYWDTPFNGSINNLYVYDGVELNEYSIDALRSEAIHVHADEN